MKYIYSVLFTIMVFTVNAQTPTLPKITPPSPNAANLASYIDKPIGLYTGTPQVALPLYTIKSGQLEIPISLNYNSGGIKVADIASWCGLGWNLNAGGMITRSIIGLADEMPSYGFLSSPALTPSLLSDPIVRQDLLPKSAKGELDNQPDQFYFSFPSGNGKFVFDKSGGINCIPLKNYKIAPGLLQRVFIDDIFPDLDAMPSGGLNNKNYIDWNITDDKGNVYKFKEFERSGTTTRDLSSPTVISGGFSGINTWYLSEIVSPTGDVIKFNYETYKVSYDMRLSKTFSRINPATVNLNWQVPAPSQMNDPVQRRFIESKRLSSIQFKTGIVRFIATSLQRADLIGDKALDKIVIEDVSGNVIKQFQFEYEYLFGGSQVPYTSYTSSIPGWNNYYKSPELLSGGMADPVALRLMLNTIKELDKNGVSVSNGYTFNYFSGLPERTSVRTDYWGYYSGKTAPRAIFLPNVNNTFAESDLLVTNKEPDFTASKAGTLFKMTYPTGGSTTFGYGSHEVNAGSAETFLPKKVDEIVVNEGLAVSYPSFNQLTLPYLTRRILPAPSARHYYVQFTVPLNATLTEVKIKLQNLPPNALAFNFYLEDINNPAPIDDPLWGSATNGEHNLMLPGGTYRLFHNPFTDIINNPQHQYYNSVPTATLTYSSVTVSSQNPNSIRNVGGVRVNTITHFDPVNNKSLTRNYKYQQSTQSSGYLVGAKPVFLYSVWSRSEEPASGGGMTGVMNHASQYFYYSCNSFYPLSTTSGSYVGYSNVEETVVDADNNFLGKTLSYFSSPATISDNVQETGTIYSMPFLPSFGTDPWYPTSFTSVKLPDPPVDSQDWRRGLLLNQIFYKNPTTDTTSIVKKINNTYEYPTSVISSGAQVGYVMKNNVPNYISGEVYQLIPYTLTTGTPLLAQTQEVIYGSNGNAPATITTTFSNSVKSLLPVKKTIARSNGAIASEYFTYPKEYAAGNAFIDSLVGRNNVSVQIETVQAKEQGSTVYVTGGSINEYYPNGKGLLKSIKSLNISTPLLSSSFKFSNALTGQLPSSASPSSYVFDSRYEDRIQFNQYDLINNNIAEQQKVKGVKEVYLWGYGGQYLLAKVVGSDYSTVSGLVNQTVLDNGTEVARVSQLATLRSYFNQNPNVQVETYTYKPLIGITSTTDAKGMTTYYDYDEFQRLQNVKDQNGNIIKNYDYHYKP